MPPTVLEKHYVEDLERDSWQLERATLSASALCLVHCLALPLLLRRCLRSRRSTPFPRRAPVASGVCGSSWGPLQGRQLPAFVPVLNRRRSIMKRLR